MENISCIGIDITTEYVQLAYAVKLDDEAESMSISTDEKKYLIPAVMYHRKANDTWYIGEEAKFVSSGEGGQVSEIKDFTIFFRCLFETAKNILGIDRAQMICVTSDRQDIKYIDGLYDALKANGYEKDKVRIINHEEAFIYYTISQKKELWVNDVVLMDFTKEHFVYKSLQRGKIEGGSALAVDNRELSGEIYYEMLSSDIGRAKADNNLLEFLKPELKKHIVSSIFLTGEGFYDDWAKESIREMCSRRRVFKGYNLYVKGACQAAKEKAGYPVWDKEYKLLCEGRTKAELGLVISNGNDDATVLLSKSGVNWIEAGAIAYCIVDNTNEIDIVVTDAVDRKKIYKKIDISGLKVRDNKTNRIEISIAYLNEDEFDVIVKDTGFGEFFKPSDTVITERISVKAILEAEE